MNMLDRLAHWWIDRRLSTAARNASTPSMEWTRLEIGPDGMTASGISPAIIDLAAEATAMLEAKNAQNYVEFDMMGRAGADPIRVTVQWAVGVSPALKASQLQTALMDMVETYCDQGGQYFIPDRPVLDLALATLARYGVVRPDGDGYVLAGPAEDETTP